MIISFSQVVPCLFTLCVCALETSRDLNLPRIILLSVLNCGNDGFKSHIWNCLILSDLFSVFVGLMTATVASEVYKAAQPALLYLVPFTLLPIIVMAYLKVPAPCHDSNTSEKSGQCLSLLGSAHVF